MKDNHVFLTFFNLKYPRDVTSNLLVNRKPKQQNQETARTVVSCYHPPLPPKAVMASENSAPFSATKCGGRKVLNTNFLSQKTLGSGQTPK